MPAERTVAIYSDPGRTSALVRRLLSQDSAAKSAVAEGARGSRPPGGAVEIGRSHWSDGAHIVHHQILLPLSADGTLDLDEIHRWSSDNQVAITIVVTELPRMAAKQPTTLELQFTGRTGIISLPALGPFMVGRLLRRELARAISALSYDTTAHGGQDVVEPPSDELLGHVHGEWGSKADARGQAIYLTTPGWAPGHLWNMLGMVAANEPLWSMGKLTGLFSAAAATSAFGIFYSTIWEMATFLSAWRLISVSVVCITLTVTWLIVSNRLWDSAAVGNKRQRLMYTSSTVVTLLVSISVLYLLLFLGILGMGSLLIDPAFMEQETGEQADLGNYVDVAWLSASLGTLAGAIGSNFDTSAHRENLTQGSREQQRYPRDEAQR